jgi:hypothetical protein
MGMIIRFPFFIVAIMIWTMVGGAISLLNIITLPIFGMASAIIPSIFKTSASDILSLGTLRRGYKNIYRFLRGGL